MNRLQVVFVNVANRGLVVFLPKKYTANTHLFYVQEMIRLSTHTTNQNSSFCEIESAVDGDLTAEIVAEFEFEWKRAAARVSLVFELGEKLG